MFNQLRIIFFFLLILVFGSIANAQVEVNQHLASTHLDMHPNAGSWSYDSTYFVIASDDGVHILTSGLRLLDHLYADEFVYSVDWHPSLYRLLVAVDDRVDILEWDANTHTAILLKTILRDDTVVFSAWNIDGSRIAIVHLSNQSSYNPGIAVGNISIWDGADFKFIRNIPSQYLVFPLSLMAYVFEWSPNNPDIFAVVGNVVETIIDREWIVLTDVMMFLIDTETGNTIQEITAGAGGVAFSLSIQPNGTYVIQGSEPGFLVYDTQTGERVGGAGVPHFDVFAMSWRPDGAYLAIEQSIYDGATFEQLASYDKEATLVEFSRDGQNLIMVSGSGDIDLQDLASIPGYVPSGG